MKKLLLTIAVVLASMLIWSFATPPDGDEITISITADKPTKFDMFQHSSTVKSAKGLTTPYEIKLNSTDSKFIFKSSDQKATLKMEAKGGGGSVSASWPIIVLLIDGRTKTTFGMD